jgi:hypothetical protein
MAHLSSCGLLAVVLTGVLLSGGCYEIPPVIPSDYSSSPVARSRHSLSVYANEPFDPRNRWFQRAFGARGLRGEIRRPRADEPFSTFILSERIDHAELRALLGSIEEESRRAPQRSLSPLAVVTRAIFLSDVLAEACRLQAAGEGARRMPTDDLVALLIAVARQGVDAEELPSVELAPLLQAPPLRDGAWTEGSAPGVPGLLPSTHDPRWTLVLLSRARPGAAVLLRLRVALSSEGGAVLLPLASECWEIRRRGKDVTHRVWRFDRAEWLHGRDPWLEFSEAAEIQIRNPHDPSQILAGRLQSLYRSCPVVNDVTGRPRVGAPFSTVAAFSPALVEIQQDLVTKALLWVMER